MTLRSEVNEKPIRAADFSSIHQWGKPQKPMDAERPGTEDGIAGSFINGANDGECRKVVDLQVTLGRLQLKNPVLVASGTFGYVREMERMVRLERLGGVIPKTVTFHPRAGNPTPRTVETASGLLNAIGLDNDGIAHFREHHLPYLRTVGTAVIANIAGEDEDQFVAMAEMLAGEPGLAAIELNISCPNVSHGLDLGIDAGAVGRLVSRVRASAPCRSSPS